MYNHIKGVLSTKSPAHAVVEAGGIGYYIRIPANTYRRLPEAGEECMLFLELVVRDDALDLYGFATSDEKRLFTELTRVNGVGPQSALAILSALAVKDFLRAVEAGDIKSICMARGVGRKLAQRVILELKGALAMEEESAPATPHAAEAEEALVALGYSRREARTRLQKACEKGDTPVVEELVRRALQVGMKK